MDFIQERQQELLDRINDETYFNFSIEIEILKSQADGLAAFDDIEKSSEVWTLINWLENQRVLMILKGFFNSREN